MPDSPNVAKGLRERLGGNPEDRLGKALSDLLESPLLAGAVGRAFDAREKASAAQEVAFGALNIPSAADIERLTRRLRSVSHRLEGIEDGVDRLDRALAPSGIEARLSAIEAHLRALTEHVQGALGTAAGSPPTSQAPGAAAPSAATHAPAAARSAPRRAKAGGGRAASQPAKKAGARRAEQAKRTAAAKAAKRAKTTTGSTRRARPAA